MLNFVSINFHPFEGSHNSIASLTITIRIYGFTHTLVGCCTIQQDGDFAHDEVVVGAHKVNGAALEGLGALGGVLRRALHIAEEAFHQIGSNKTSNTCYEYFFNIFSFQKWFDYSYTIRTLFLHYLNSSARLPEGLCNPSARVTEGSGLFCYAIFLTLSMV